MKNFTTFREDLASGRPLKKPVSSNLLKQRKKENEKALKSGFMKMPDYVKKKFNEEEEMKPHKMYKGDKVVMAKNKAEHDKLNKQGYTHDNPKTEKVEEEKKNCGCGQDPCITYGKKQMKEAKKPVVHSTKPDSLKTVKIKYNKPIGVKVTNIGPGGKETVVKNTMQEQQMQIVTNLDFNESLGNLVSRGLDKVRSSIKDAEKRTGLSVDASKNNKNNPVSGDNIRKRLASQKKR